MGANSMGAQDGSDRNSPGYHSVQHAMEGSVTIPRISQSNNFPYPLTQVEKEGLMIAESKRKLVRTKCRIQKSWREVKVSRLRVDQIKVKLIGKEKENIMENDFFSFLVLT